MSQLGTYHIVAASKDGGFTPQINCGQTNVASDSKEERKYCDVPGSPCLSKKGESDVHDYTEIYNASSCAHWQSSCLFPCKLFLQWRSDHPSSNKFTEDHCKHTGLCDNPGQYNIKCSFSDKNLTNSVWQSTGGNDG